MWSRFLTLRDWTNISTLYYGRAADCRRRHSYANIVTYRPTRGQNSSVSARFVISCSGLQNGLNASKIRSICWQSYGKDGAESKNWRFNCRGKSGFSPQHSPSSTKQSLYFTYVAKICTSHDGNAFSLLPQFCHYFMLLVLEYAYSMCAYVAINIQCVSKSQ